MHFSFKKTHLNIARGKGGPTNFVSHHFYFFCDLKPHTKFQNHTITSSGRKVTRAERERKRKEEKTPLIVVT